MRTNAIVLLMLVAVIGLLSSVTVSLGLLAAAPVLWWLRRRMSLPPSLSVSDELRDEVNDLTVRAGIDTVDVVITTEGAAAGSLPGRHPGALIVRSDLVGWPAPMRRAVLAHEIAHLQRRDFASTLIALLASLTVMLATFTACLALAPQTPAGSLLGFAASIAIGCTLGVLVSSWVQRRVELKADAVAVHLTGDPEALVAAIERIDADHQDSAVDARTRRMPMWLERAVSTHPVTGDRVAALRSAAGAVTAK